MASKLPEALTQYNLLTLTSGAITPGSEPASYRFVNLAGALTAGAGAIGISGAASRAGCVPIVVKGITVVNVAASQTLVVGSFLEADANGRAIIASDATKHNLTKGTALDACTSGAGDTSQYIRILLA